MGIFSLEKYISNGCYIECIHQVGNACFLLFFFFSDNLSHYTQFGYCVFCVFRGYLRNVARKLADDVENLKSNASSLGRQKEEWMERRTLKRDKGGNLELQLQLKNEISEKAKTQEQLTQITAQMAEMES